MSTVANTLFTVGHSVHPIETFIALLKKHDVTAIADVRSAPFSRFNPQFNKVDFEASLSAQGIHYVFLGRELGARSDDPACYENGQVRYSRIARTAGFLEGIERILAGAQKYKIALMCAEKEPLDCHRTVLVARALVERGVEVKHILADGSLEDYDHAVSRMLDVVGLPQEDLFRSREELVTEAMARQEERIAYVDERLTAAGGGEAK